jgi:hypothetical protein
VSATTVSAERDIAAPAGRAYRISAEFRNHHPHILLPAFTDLVVQDGGIGEGTVIRFTVTTAGRTQETRQRIEEPEPGRMLVERVPLMMDHPRSAVARGQLTLDIVRVPERQDVETEVRTKVRDLAVRHAVLVEHADRLVEVLPGLNGETEMIEADAVLIEAVPAAVDSRVGSRPETEKHLAVAQQHPWWQLHRYVEAQHVRIERTGSGDIRYRQP